MELYENRDSATTKCRGHVRTGNLSSSLIRNVLVVPSLVTLDQPTPPSSNPISLSPFSSVSLSVSLCLSLSLSLSLSPPLSLSFVLLLSRSRSRSCFVSFPLFLFSLSFFYRISLNDAKTHRSLCHCRKRLIDKRRARLLLHPPWPVYAFSEGIRIRKRARIFFSASVHCALGTFIICRGASR